ncbi:MAG: nicotinate-nucleotide adenylyltransferase [Chthoniobacteraceae bacterium]
MRIGLYGGSFNPVHHGHLMLAHDAFETLHLDRLFFIPAAVSPHKLSAPPVSPELRVKMLLAAIDGDTRFSVDEIELHRPPPSFAIDTLREIACRYAGARLFYLIGEDNLAALSTWHKIDEMMTLAHFVVARRQGNGLVAAEPSGMTFLPRVVDISSTEIREAVAQGRSFRPMVHPEVANIITKMNLYAPPG